MWLPDLWKLLSRRVGKLIRRGEPDQAIALVSRYVRLRPRDPIGWIQLKLLIQDFTEDPDGRRQEEILREGLRRCPGSSDLELVLGSLLAGLFEKTGERQHGLEAQQLFERQRAKHPDSLRPLRGLAMLEAIQGHDEQALALVDEARRRMTLTDDLGYAGFWQLLWVLLRIRGGEERALQWLRDATGDYPGWAEFPLLLGLLLEHSDQAAASHYRSLGEAQWRGTSEELAQWLEDNRQNIEGSRTAPKRTL